MMRKHIYTLFLLAMIVFQARSQDSGLKDLLPDPSSLGSWQYSREPECYVGENLFDLMNGGADLYFEYRFVKVVNAQYSENGGSKIQVEIYEMDSDTSAYGIFSSIFNTHEVSKEIGYYSVIDNQYVAFVKDRYYVNIAWVVRKEARVETLVRLAGMVEEKITGQGRSPLLVSRLDEVFRVGIPVYFRGNIALSNVYYFDFRDVFRIDQGVAFKEDKMVKMVFQYGNGQDSGKIFAEVQDFIGSSKRFRDMGMIYQGFTCSDNKGNRLVFRSGPGFISVVAALSPEVMLMQEQEEFFGILENSIR